MNEMHPIKELNHVHIFTVHFYKVINHEKLTK